MKNSPQLKPQLIDFNYVTGDLPFLYLDLSNLPQRDSLDAGSANSLSHQVLHSKLQLEVAHIAYRDGLNYISHDLARTARETLKDRYQLIYLLNSTNLSDSDISISYPKGFRKSLDLSKFLKHKLESGLVERPLIHIDISADQWMQDLARSTKTPILEFNVSSSFANQVEVKEVLHQLESILKYF